jgi:AmiR/NasT family two-component response regulator
METLATERTVVYQAMGMIAVQLSVGLEEAIAVLRARAYAAGRPVCEVAADVVARRFRFDP